MILIIGGAYQGKLAFAKERFPHMGLVEGFHETVRTLTEQNADVQAAVEQMLPQMADKVVLCRDIFSGVVPMDPVVRRYREDCGRALALLSKNADQVFRVFCGIGTRIV